MNYKLVCYLSISAFFIFGCGTERKLSRALPEQNNGIYSIRLENQVMEIYPAKGGRISSLKLEGNDFFTDSTVNNFNWGSTFWFSPQSEWKWPPSSEIDNQPYRVRIENRELIMVSPQDPKTGLVLTKAISANNKTGSYLLKYTITNKSDKSQKVAPWEVTRIHTNGLAFFPFGDGDRRGGLIPFTTEKDGISWFQYHADQLPLKGDRQLYSDGAEGWLAAVNGDALLIKKFPDIPFEKNAPNEGEIEWYASPVVPGKSYVEIEHQGAYEELQPGSSSIWQVEWFLRKLPSDIKPDAGNQALLNYVRKIVK